MLETQLKSLLHKRKSVTLGLWGDPGVGKSYAVKTLLANSGLSHLSLHATTSLNALAKTLPRPKKISSWAGQFYKRLENNEALENKILIEFISTTLANLAPFILYLEDIHETNPEQLEFIQTVAQQLLVTKGVGLIVTSRRLPPEPFEAQKLLPLEKEPCNQLLQNTLKAQLPATALSWIYERARGNPLYSLEYLRFLARQGFLWNDGEHWNWRPPETALMPANIENLIELHLSKIQDANLEFTQQVKAFLPQDASDQSWAAMLNVSANALKHLKDELEEESILQGNQFVHPLYREVILKKIPESVRQELTQKALTVFEDDPIQAALLIGEANFPAENALTYVEKAAKAAKDKGQKALAGKLLTQAVAYATGQRQGQLALEAAHLLDGLDYPKMLNLTQIACQTLSDPTEALYLQTSVFAIQGKYQEMQRAIDALPGNAKQGFRWFEHYLKLLYQSTQYQSLISYWEKYQQDFEVDSNSIHFVGWSYVHIGKFQEASQLTNDWLSKTTLNHHDRWNLLQIRASIAFYQGNYQAAENDYSDCLNLDIANEPQQDIANVLRNRSVTRLQLGQYQESLPDLEKALDIYSHSGNKVHYAQTLVMLSYVTLELGDYERTETVLLEALDIFNAIPPQPFLSHALVQISQLYLDMPNRIYLAKKYALEARNISETLNDKSCSIIALPAVAKVELQLGSVEKALELAAQTLNGANAMGIYEAQLMGHYTRGLALVALGQIQEARQAFVTAYEGAKTQGMLLEEQRFALELDRLDHNLLQAKQRLRWFEERKLMNGAMQVYKYFPELAKTSVDNQSRMSELKVLGRMHVDQRDYTETIQGQKRQELLAILLEARMTGLTEVRKLELFDTLYPEKSERQANSSLKELISALRDRLGNGIITTTTNGYALGNVSSDAELFLETLDTSLWRGVYLPDIHLDKKSVSESLYVALYTKAQAMLESNPNETARVSRILLEDDPYNLEYLTLCLKALRASNNHKSLNRLYEEAKIRFGEVGEDLPEQWQEFLKH